VTKAEHSTYLEYNHTVVEVCFCYFIFDVLNRSYFYVLLIVRNFFAFIFNVLACFAQFSQIEQRNILLTFSRNDGKSRQELTIFIQYLGYNLGYLN